MKAQWQDYLKITALLMLLLFGGAVSDRAMAVEFDGYFVMTALDSDTNESAYSNEVFKSTAGTGEIELCWVPPTQNVDLSPLTDLSGYNIYMGNTSGNYTNSLPVNDSSATCFTIFNGPRPVPNPDPMPPVIIGDNLTVFTIIKQPNRFVLLVVGTVPPGTACIPDQSVNGLNVVPTSDVVWTSTSRPIVVVARCVEG